MYSRYEARREAPIRLPENYGGTLFSGSPAPSDPTEAHRVEIAQPSPPTASRRPPLPSLEKAPSERIFPAVLPTLPHGEREKASAPPPMSPPSPPTLHVNLPFLHGIGFDELLILGLILLLSHNDEQSDVILWLALLLFCG